MWTSEFLLTRARLSKHFFIDCTFYKPKAFEQTPIIAIREPLTEKFIPVAFGLVNSKKSHVYETFLHNFSKLLNSDKNFNKEEYSWTSDFENGLLEAIKKIFPGSRHLGSYFHYLKRLHGQGQYLGLTKKNLRNLCLKLKDQLKKLCFVSQKL